MSGFQFVHVECYGRTAGKGKAGGRTLRSVVEEAEREPQACPHVDEPQPPNLLHGMMPSEAAEVAERRAGEAVDASGRKLRKDALVMVAGVASFPDTMDEIRSDPARMAAYEAWRADAVAWAKTEYGDALLSVVEHVDERHPHIHWYAVPELDGNTKRMSVETIHDGRRKAAECKANGGLKGEQNAAYKQAMREFQSRYFDAVGMKNGQARLGPGCRRLSRAEWRAEQAQAEALSKTIAAAADYQGEVKAKVEGQARKYLQKAQRDALERAKEVERVETAKARQKASSIVARAREDASKLVAPVRRFGGFLQAMLDGMTGRRRKVEAEAEAKVEAVREELSREVRDVRGKLDSTRDEVKSLRETNKALNHSVAETVRQRNEAWEKVEHLSKLVPQHGKKAGLGTPAPRG